jgi:uncharacterized protein with HEPN domain
MTEKEKKYLSDIINSIGLIENFTKDLASFAAYEKDLKTKGAVERHLGIIGEAVNKFLKESATNELKNASQIISLRNRLIHSYDNIDDSIIWSIVTRQIRPLKDEVRKKIE